MKNNIYFAIALIDCFLGFVYALNDHWGWGVIMFVCGFIMASNIKTGAK